jgi:UDP-glucose 4-epimerase
LKILVTGGAGYIGSTTVAHLLTAGHEVVVYDNLSHGFEAALPAGAELIVGDIGDRAQLDQVFAQGMDAIIHFAGLIEAGESMIKPAKYISNNVGASTILIDAAQASGIRNIVFSSSAAVYASQDQPISEDSLIRPVNVYGQTKRMVEEILAWYHQLYGMKSCSLRYFNASGASRFGGAIRGEVHKPETHLIPLVLQVALNQRDSISIFGSDYPTPDGTNIRDYIHIDDLALAHVRAVEGLVDEREALWVYNLGNGLGYSNLEVLETARHITGHSIPAVMAPRRSGDGAILIASSEKITAELGWQPKYPELEKIIASAWEWHSTHPNGYGR